LHEKDHDEGLGWEQWKPASGPDLEADDRDDKGLDVLIDEACYRKAVCRLTDEIYKMMGKKK
jgi:hypothetical protein